ncbi:MAG TPA: hypothetical protein VM598_00250 [Bdellovibrionota bacterium]|nr:hypothetical protein [Bdellovibrionota bacterium]
MQRNCPHCGQDQIIADEDIVAPWVFTKCHSCGNLSVVRKEMIAGASSRDKPAARGKAAAILRKKDQIEQRRARKAARTRETLQASAPAPAASFERAQPERLESGRSNVIESFSAPESAWNEAKLPPTPPPFLRKNEVPIEAERLMAAPEPQVARKTDLKPFAAILIALVLVLIGLQLRMPQREADPAPAAAIERQEIPTTMSAPARPAAEAPATAPPVPEARATNATPIWTVQVAREGALLRSGPGQEYRKLGTLDLGARLLVRKWEKNWFQVELENLAPGTLGIGWIRGDLIIQAGQTGQAGS